MTHYENFDFLRLVAAASVLFSHAFLIARGDESREPLRMLLDEHDTLGIYAVFIFLIMSGFLVSRSAELSGSLAWFLRKRASASIPD